MPEGFLWSFQRNIVNPELWEQFHECIDKLHHKILVKCKHCHDGIYAHPGTITGKGSRLTYPTSSLSRHLADCPGHKKSINNSEMAKSGNFFQRRTSKPLSADDVMDKALDFFISGNIPFNQIDNPAFQELLARITVDGKPVHITRKSIRERLNFHAQKAKEDLMVCLMQNESKISLALDCWTSKNNYAFLGISMYHTF